MDNGITIIMIIVGGASLYGLYWLIFKAPRSSGWIRNVGGMSGEVFHTYNDVRKPHPGDTKQWSQKEFAKLNAEEKEWVRTKQPHLLPE